MCLREFANTAHKVGRNPFLSSSPNKYAVCKKSVISNSLCIFIEVSPYMTNCMDCLGNKSISLRVSKRC